MKLKRHAFTLITASTSALAAMIVSSACAAPTDQSVPPAAPPYDYDDPSRSFLVRLDFGSTSATLIDASVGEQRSYSHVGDPPLLRLSLTDEDGAAAGTINAWDPRWYFDETPGGGERLILRNGPATLVFPFDGDVASVLVHDQRAGIDLATVDLLPAVHEFCLTHPGDPECVQADLAVTATSATGDTLAVLGQTVTVRVDSVIADLGPDGPADAHVTQTATASAGVTVTPAGRTFDVDALAVGSPATVSGDYDVTCTTLGDQTVTVTTAVTPVQAKVVDLNPANDSASVTFGIDCAVPVTVNVTPGSLTNPVAVNGGALPLAVLTTKAGEYGNPFAFDAATIAPMTVRIATRATLVGPGPGAPELHGKVHLEDSYELDEKTRDRDKDGVLHAQASQLDILPTTVEICVRGRFGPGATVSFFGCDHITQVP